MLETLKGDRFKGNQLEVFEKIFLKCLARSLSIVQTMNDIHISPLEKIVNELCVFKLIYAWIKNRRAFVDGKMRSGGSKINKEIKSWKNYPRPVCTGHCAWPKVIGLGRFGRVVVGGSKNQPKPVSVVRIDFNLDGKSSNLMGNLG